MLVGLPELTAKASIIELVITTPFFANAMPNLWLFTPTDNEALNVNSKNLDGAGVVYCNLPLVGAFTFERMELVVAPINNVVGTVYVFTATAVAAELLTKLKWP